MTSWPTDSQGNPMEKVEVVVEEKIGLPEYSNVTLGARVTRLVSSSSPEDTRKALSDLGDLVEGWLSEEREAVIDLTKRT